MNIYTITLTSIPNNSSAIKPSKQINVPSDLLKSLYEILFTMPIKI